MEQQKKLWEKEKQQQKNDRALAGKELKKRPVTLKLAKDNSKQQPKQNKPKPYPTDNIMRKILGI